MRVCSRRLGGLGGLRALSKNAAEPFCIFVFAPSNMGAYSRMFAPAYGIVEDPATGSSTGPLASYMIRHKLAPGDGIRFISEQGTSMGRRNLLHINVQGQGIEVGGYVTPVIDATLHLEL